MIYHPFISHPHIGLGKDIRNAPIHRKLEAIESWLSQYKYQKDITMLYLVMYDIENDRVRNQIAKYLLRKGCMRIQKSVYLSKSSRTTYHDIHQTLREINDLYANEDSIFLLPVPEEKFQNIKVIGKNVEFDIVTKHKSLLFF
ncbi:MAG: CRISPR-associated endonuclease Cas2 [Saprospiraceae bacterium]